MSEDNASDLSKYELESLAAHNSYRKIHQAPPFTYNKEISKECQAWANHLAPLGLMEHSTTTYGENIWYKWATNLGEVLGKEAVDAWYDEIKDYDFSQPGFKSETGHFTQLVWKSSTEMGVAYAVHENQVIAVAQYSPSGNITNTGYFENNVLLPIATAEPAANPEESISVEKPAPVEEAPQPLAAEEQPSLEANVTEQPAPEETAPEEEPTPVEEPAEEVIPSEETHAPTEEVPPAEEEPTPTEEPAPEEVAPEEVAPEEVAPEEVAPEEVAPEEEPVLTEETVSAEKVAPEEIVEKVPSELELTPFELEALVAHNKYRKIHNALELVFDQELKDECKMWADAVAASGTIEDSTTKNGENIWFKPGAMEISGKEPVNAWYEEINDYDFNSPGFSSLTGKFTQLIWKDSTRIGIAYTVGKSGIFVVAQYKPAGNIKNPRVFASNVMPEDKASMEKAEGISETHSDVIEPLTSLDVAGDQITKFQQEALEAHNQYRQFHGAPLLTYSMELSNDCKVWADVLAPGGVIEPSPTNNGENIWAKVDITEGQLSGKEPVDTWYAENKYYDFEKPGLNDVTAHFTQLVWQETKQMGIAYSVSNKGAFVVAQYSPPGNISKPNSFEANVLPSEASIKATKEAAATEVPPAREELPPPEVPPTTEKPPSPEPPAAEKPPSPEPPAAEKPPSPEPPAAEKPPSPEPPAAEKPPSPQPPAAEKPPSPETPAAEELPVAEQAPKEPAESPEAKAPPSLEEKPLSPPQALVAKPEHRRRSESKRAPGIRPCPRKKDPKLKKAERSPCN